MKSNEEVRNANETYIQRLAREYKSIDTEELKRSLIDSTILDSILSLPTPAKEFELVRYLWEVGLNQEITH